MCLVGRNWNHLVALFARDYPQKLWLIWWYVVIYKAISSSKIHIILISFLSLARSRSECIRSVNTMYSIVSCLYASARTQEPGGGEYRTNHSSASSNYTKDLGCQVGRSETKKTKYRRRTWKPFKLMSASREWGETEEAWPSLQLCEWMRMSCEKKRKPITLEYVVVERERRKAQKSKINDDQITITVSSLTELRQCGCVNV